MLITMKEIEMIIMSIHRIMMHLILVRIDTIEKLLGFALKELNPYF